MAIVLSEIIENSVQIDGRRWIKERHTDSIGIRHFITYLANSNFDYNAALSARIANLEESLKLNEIQKNYQAILSDTPLTFNHVTLNEFSTAIRIIYMAARGEEACRLSKWMLERTDAQLRSIFNIVQGQVAALRTRLQTKVDKLSAVLAESGE